MEKFNFAIYKLMFEGSVVAGAAGAMRGYTPLEGSLCGVMPNIGKDCLLDTCCFIFSP